MQRFDFFGPLQLKPQAPRLGLHAFRHTLASKAQRQLRHSDASTNLGRYGHILGNDHREAVEAIEAVLVLE